MSREYHRWWSPHLQREMDVFLENNRGFSHALWGKGIWHGFHVWSGEAHCAAAWQRMVPHYL